jgi:hypothetical protein
MSSTTARVERGLASSGRLSEAGVESDGVFTEPALASPLRELSREETAAEVVAYLGANGQTDSFDLALALDLDPEYVESLCAELASNGQIAVK